MYSFTSLIHKLSLTCACEKMGGRKRRRDVGRTLQNIVMWWQTLGRCRTLPFICIQCRKGSGLYYQLVIIFTRLFPSLPPSQLFASSCRGMRLLVNYITWEMKPRQPTPSNTLPRLSYVWPVLHRRAALGLGLRLLYWQQDSAWTFLPLLSYCKRGKYTRNEHP